jgi:hypothetical protein
VLWPLALPNAQHRTRQVASFVHVYDSRALTFSPSPLRFRPHSTLCNEKQWRFKLGVCVCVGGDCGGRGNVWVRGEQETLAQCGKWMATRLGELADLAPARRLPAPFKTTSSQSLCTRSSYDFMNAVHDSRVQTCRECLTLQPAQPVWI